MHPPRVYYASVEIIVKTINYLAPTKFEKVQKYLASPRNLGIKEGNSCFLANLKYKSEEV